MWHICYVLHCYKNTWAQQLKERKAQWHELEAASWSRWVRSQRLTLQRAHCPQGASYPSPRLSVLFRKTTLCRQKRPLVNEMSEIKHAEQILNHLFICVNESCLPGKIKYFQGFQGPGFMLDYCWLLLVSF